MRHGLPKTWVAQELTRFWCEAAGNDAGTIPPYTGGLKVGRGPGAR